VKLAPLLAAVAGVAAAALGCAGRDDESREATSSSLRASSTSPGTCGAQGHECPLHAWMKSNASPPMTSADFPRLARSFDRIAALAPGGTSTAPGFEEWKDMARAGATAAAAHDLEGARSACKWCHDAYRGKYRAERRAAPLP